MSNDNYWKLPELTKEDEEKIRDRYNSVKNHLYAEYRANDDRGKLYQCGDDIVNFLINEVVESERRAIIAVNAAINKMSYHYNGRDIFTEKDIYAKAKEDAIRDAAIAAAKAVVSSEPAQGSPQRGSDWGME